MFVSLVDHHRQRSGQTEQRTQNEELLRAFGEDRQEEGEKIILIFLNNFMLHEWK